MLIKKELERLPLMPSPQPEKDAQYSAGATLHKLPRCGQVLAVDVYNRKKQLLYRFFSDGKNYVTWIEQPYKSFHEQGWTKRNPIPNSTYSYEKITATPESVKAIQNGLGLKTGMDKSDIWVSHAIGSFIYETAWNKRQKARDAREERMRKHFAMFPAYPKDLAKFCENHVFADSILYVSKLQKGKREAVCRHCGKAFQVGGEVKPGGSGHCPKCGAVVNYRAQWAKNEVVHKAKICVAYKVEGQLLLCYVDVVRTILPDNPKPQYDFSDYFKTLLLDNRGKSTEYAYAWCQAPYRGFDWYRLRNGSRCYGNTFVYTNNLCEVFGEDYCHVDLQASLTDLRRPIHFHRLLDNLKDIPQTEYLLKAGLPVLASNILPRSEARSLPEFIGIGKEYLPALRESQADFEEIRLITDSGDHVPPDDLRTLCALRLNGYELQNLRRIIQFSPLGRALRYVQSQKEQAAPLYKRRGISYFIGIYRDYLNMAEELSSDMTKRAVLEPPDLCGRHSLLIGRVNERKEELKNNRLPRAIENGLYWWARPYVKDGLCIAYPEKRSDFTVEGQKLNHCVGTSHYYENHVMGRRMVFFIRRDSAADKPYFTTEIDVETGQILQLYGFADCSAPKEVRSFTEGFARAVVRWRSRRAVVA